MFNVKAAAQAAAFFISDVINRSSASFHSASGLRPAASARPQLTATLRANTLPIDQYQTLLRRPEWRDARAYVLPSDQRDFLTATKFMNALIKTGVQVHRASAPLTAGGNTYPAGSYVVKTAQPFRPHVLDMFEPQDHPNDFQYPGGPPIPPYDNAGWTLAYQMGVQFDRILKARLPLEPIQQSCGTDTTTNGGRNS